MLSKLINHITKTTMKTTISMTEKKMICISILAIISAIVTAIMEWPVYSVITGYLLGGSIGYIVFNLKQKQND